jgi:hypothetical protein
MNIDIRSKLLISAGGITSTAAIWHLACIIGGPSWFIFARAPQQVIDSAQQGTLLAPFSTTVVAAAMFACTIFAFSAAGIIRKVPLVTPALMTIAVLCTLRGLIIIPTLMSTKGIDVWQVVASAIWLYVGICFIVGTLANYRLGKISQPANNGLTNN